MLKSTDFFHVSGKNFNAGIMLLEEGPVTENNYKKIIELAYDFYLSGQNERPFLNMSKQSSIREAKKFVHNIREQMNNYYEFNVCAEIILLDYPKTEKIALKIVNLSGEENKNNVSIIDFAKDIRRRTIIFFEGIVNKIYNDYSHKNDAKPFYDLLIIARQQEMGLKRSSREEPEESDKPKYWWQRD